MFTCSLRWLPLQGCYWVPVGLLVGRGIGAVYLGLAITFWLVRHAPPSDLHLALCVGAMVLLTGLGLFEFKVWRAGPTILISESLEVVLTVGLLSDLSSWRTVEKRLCSFYRA